MHGDRKRPLFGRTVSGPLISNNLRFQPAMTTTTLTNRIHIRQLWAQYTDAILANDNRRADTLRAEISKAEREELQAEC